MKSTSKLFIFSLLLLLLVLGCDNKESILTGNEGLWKITSLQRVTYLNGNFVSDVTQVDSLGDLYFAKDGSGYRSDYAGVKEPIIWTLYSKDDSISIYFSRREFAAASISSTAKDALTLKWNTESGGLGSETLVETTSKMKRQ